MSHSDAIDQGAVQTGAEAPVQKRRIANAIWRPFIQFKLLMFMLGTTALVAILLGGFLYYAFSDLINMISDNSDTTSYYGEMMEIQLVHLFRYCGALFLLYIVLLAAICVTYTHKLVGPFHPFTRHVDALNNGDYSSRVTLRKEDLDIYNDYADKLNTLAADLQDKQSKR